MDHSDLEQSTHRANELVAALGTKIVGQETVLRETVAAVIAGGHVLLEGVPGLGKTLLAMSLAKAIGGSFSRIQFTPDLMPADIIGTTVYRGGTATFETRKGPVFCDILLADEINRSPAKTQSALLEAMQERAVTIDGTPLPLGDAFFCVATQNPFEMEGTYPLPESQLDRFLMNISIGYPSEEEEQRLLARYRDGYTARNVDDVPEVISIAELEQIRASAGAIVCDDSLLDYIRRIVLRTRSEKGVALGASPRATVSLFLATRAWALLSGRSYAVPDDAADIALAVLRHRIVLTPEAEIEGLTSETVLRNILSTIEVPR
jgi:MoxR-like ATPase